MRRPASDTSPHPAVLAVYACWLVAVVVFLLGRYTTVPSFDLAYAAVVVGTGFFVVLGTIQLIHDWLPWLRAAVAGDEGSTGEKKQ